MLVEFCEISITSTSFKKQWRQSAPAWPGLRPRPPRASVVASKLSESQYANFDCRNVSRSERPHFAYEGTIEYYQHYMQPLGLENINIYQARPHSHIYFTGQSTSQHSQLLVGFF